jgi:uncharacterized protein
MLFFLFSFSNFHSIPFSRLVIPFPGFERMENPRQSIKRKAEALSEKLQNVVVPKKLLDFVEKHMKAMACGAHDVAHVHRVANLARMIALEEGADQTIAYVAGLVHDMLDSKLIDEDGAKGAEEILTRILENDMNETKENWSHTDTSRVLDICKTVGYKNLLKKDWKPENRSVEYRCVQDADLLDAIGAVGVARCFAFGGKRQRLMFGVANSIGPGITAEQYKAAKGSGVEHFFDKLLLIKDMMTTPTGKLMAIPRHNNMLDFLHALEGELSAGGDYDTIKQQASDGLSFGEKLSSFSEHATLINM